MKKNIVLALNWGIFFALCALISGIYYGFLPKEKHCPKNYEIRDVVDEVTKKANESASSALNLADKTKFNQIASENWKNPDFELSIWYAFNLSVGEGCEKDFKHAAEILEFCLNNPKLKDYFVEHVYLYLANLYDLGGFGLAQNKDRAGELLEKLIAKKSHADIYSVLGDIYRGRAFCGNRKVLPQNKEFAKKALKKFLDADIAINSNEIYWLGGVFKDANLQMELTNALIRHYEAGDTESIYADLAERYYFGIGCEKNPEATFKIFKRHYDKNYKYNKNLSVLVWLMAMYQNGEGTPKNLSMANRIKAELKADLEKEARTFSKSGVWEVDCCKIWIGRDLYTGIASPKNLELADEFIKFSDYLVEKYAYKSGSEKLINFYKKIGDDAKVEELYKRYAKRSKRFEGEYARYLKSKKR